MKIKSFAIKQILAIVACLLALLSTATLLPSTKAVSTAFSGYSSNLTPQQLHNATLASSVSPNAAAITVLTHGLTGKAGDWSNGMHRDANNNWIEGGIGAQEFAYNPNSLIERMRSRVSGGINLFRASIPLDLDVTEFKLFSEYGNDYSPEVSVLNNFSKHIVIVFESAGCENKTNGKLYQELDYIIDKVSYDYLTQMHSLPKINLIGYSRGGLTNMDYTIAHPKNVGSLISLGAPYNGTWYANPISDLLELTNIDVGLIGQMEIANAQQIATRKSNWNSIYGQNTHINFHALSGTTSYSFLNKLVYGDYLESFLGSATAALAVQAAFVATYPIHFFGGFWVSILTGELFNGNGLDFEILPGDVSVDKASQMAVGYSGVNLFNKHYTSSNCDFEKRAQNMPPVPHNLHVYDTDIQNYVLNNMQISAPIYTITLNRQGGSGGTSTVYEKYGVSWHLNANGTDSPSGIAVPTMAGATFGGYYTSNDGGLTLGSMVITASGAW